MLRGVPAEGVAEDPGKGLKAGEGVPRQEKAFPAASGNRLPPWREWVVAVGIAFANLPVLTMNKQFRLLIPGDIPCPVDRLALRCMHRRGALTVFGLDRPAPVMGHNMLVSSRHNILHILIQLDHGICWLAIQKLIYSCFWLTC